MAEFRETTNRQTGKKSFYIYNNESMKYKRTTQKKFEFLKKYMQIHGLNQSCFLSQNVGIYNHFSYSFN